ncbi:hypothetical protein CKA34_22950 (plasmid) [Rhizobium sp. 11515TR]|nr:hypothetical protein CKA34_22950 [Rhizobium sp. 11515TR]
MQEAVTEASAASSRPHRGLNRHFFHHPYTNMRIPRHSLWHERKIGLWHLCRLGNKELIYSE